MDRFSSFTVLIGSLNRSIKRIKTEETKEFNLKGPHVSCLYYLYKEGALTAKELTSICEEDKAAISRSLDYLETCGFIYCDSVLKKRYNSQLLLTEKGKFIGESISKKIDSIVEQASLGITEEERQILYKCLNIIDGNLKKLGE